MQYLVVPELGNNWFMQEKADVFEQVEGPRGCGAFIHLLLVFGLMRVDAFEDAQAPEKQRKTLKHLCDKIVLAVEIVKFSNPKYQQITVDKMMAP